MSTLTRWNPLRESVPVYDPMDRLFKDSFIGPGTFRYLSSDGETSVRLDVYDEDNNLTVKASMPGIKPEELNVQIQNDVLTISNETKKDEKRKDQDYDLRERRYERFLRSVALPYAVNADKADVTFANGVLTLTLPKVTEACSTPIRIKTK